MISFEQFRQMNSQRIGSEWMSKWSEEEMERNYVIALQVEKNYYEKYGTEKKPKLGDIIEYTDGFRVYKYAKIVENLYYEDQNTRVCVCENGSSHTYNGRNFSTSGGAFHGMNKSDLQYVGEDVNVIWTWGCHGAGADQGIYIPLKVNRWIIPYDTMKVKRSVVRFKRNDDNELCSVWIENSGEYFHAKTFNSMRAFEAWAKYVGYDYKMDKDAWSTEVAYSPQEIKNRCWTETLPKPSNGKPIKVLANARIHNGIVVTEKTCITEWWENIYRPGEKEPEYGSHEYHIQQKEYDKYHENPMGV